MSIAIYSDFDGVFNIKKTKNTRSIGVKTQDTEFLAPLSFVHWNPYVVVRMKEFLSSGDYEFIWHTTWNHGNNSKSAANSIGLLGLGNQSPARLNAKAVDKREWTQWKAEYIVQDQKRNPRPFIWIDDHAPLYWTELVEKNTQSPSKILLTNSETGLTLDEIDGLAEWVKHEAMGASDELLDAV